jgi:hypothetical protein
VSLVIQEIESRAGSLGVHVDGKRDAA